MGLSSDPFGSSLMGEDALGDAPAPRTVEYPRALLIDGGTMAAELDADGLYVETHPIHQKVALAMLVVRGRIAAVPTMGSRVRGIEEQRPSLKAEVEAAIREATSSMVSADEIRVDRIEVETTSNGYAAALYYTPLQTMGGGQQARATVAG